MIFLKCRNQPAVPGAIINAYEGSDIPRSLMAILRESWGQFSMYSQKESANSAP